MILWRGCLLLLAALWFAVAAHDVYRIVTEPGLFSWTLGAVHGLFLLALGVAAGAIAVVSDGRQVRDMTRGMLRDMFSRRNLGECALVIGVAVLAAFVVVALTR